MQFAVVKLTFESVPASGQPDRKDVAAFLDRFRAKFKIVALMHSHPETKGELSIAYVTLAQTQETLTQQMDAIVNFCEQQGFGRIADESVLMDDIDNLES